MSDLDESQLPKRGDVILRTAGSGFELIDAVSHAVLASEIPSLTDAIEEARCRNASAIWQQQLDFRGRPMGEPFRLQRPNLPKP